MAGTAVQAGRDPSAKHGPPWVKRRLTLDRLTSSDRCNSLAHSSAENRRRTRREFFPAPSRGVQLQESGILEPLTKPPGRRGRSPFCSADCCQKGGRSPGTVLLRGSKTVSERFRRPRKKIYASRSTNGAGSDCSAVAEWEVCSSTSNTALRSVLVRMPTSLSSASTGKQLIPCTSISVAAVSNG